MARYGTPPTETWDIEVSKNKGYPYTYPFIYDRVENRYITQPTETWTTDVPKTDS